MLNVGLANYYTWYQLETKFAFVIYSVCAWMFYSIRLLWEFIVVRHHGLIIWRYVHMHNSNRKFYQQSLWFYCEFMYTLPRSQNISPTEEAFKGGLNSSYEAVYVGQLCAVWVMNVANNWKNASCVQQNPKKRMTGQLAVLGAIIVLLSVFDWKLEKLFNN